MDLEAPVLQVPGRIANFEDPQNVRGLIIMTLTLCIVVASPIVLMRLWTRFVIQKVHDWGDYAIVAAWLSYIAYVVLGFEALKYGYGVHLYDIPFKDFFKFLFYANILEVFYNPIIFLIKFAILFQFVRIFCPHGTGWTRRIIWFLVAFNFLFYTAVMIAQIMECSPREKIWHPYLDGKCLDLPTIFISGAIVNMVSDFSILILPLFKIWSLKLSTSQKAGISSVFLTGIFACLSSIMRLENNVRFKNSVDVTWDLTAIALWTNAEIASGLICGCLPIVPAFFRHYVPKVKASLTTGATRSSGARSNDVRSRAVQEGALKDGTYIELNEHGDTTQLVRSV